MLEDAGFEEAEVTWRVGQSDAVGQVPVISKHQVSTREVSKIGHPHKSFHVVTRVVVRKYLEVMEDCHAEEAGVLAHELESMVPLLDFADNVLVAGVCCRITHVEQFRSLLLELLTRMQKVGHFSQLVPRAHVRGETRTSGSLLTWRDPIAKVEDSTPALSVFPPRLLECVVPVVRGRRKSSGVDRAILVLSLIGPGPPQPLKVGRQGLSVDSVVELGGEQMTITGKDLDITPDDW